MWFSLYTLINSGVISGLYTNTYNNSNSFYFAKKNTENDSSLHRLTSKFLSTQKIINYFKFTGVQKHILADKLTSFIRIKFSYID